MKRTLSSQTGAAMVEFAIVLPLLLTITFGIIEFGALIYNKQVITNASREGARAGIVASSPRVPATGVNSIDSVVQQYCTRLVTFGAKTNPVTSTTGYSANAPFGNSLSVQVDYQYSFLVIPNFIPGINKLFQITAVTVMNYE